jgi:CDP-diglyceride synthetase
VYKRLRDFTTRGLWSMIMISGFLAVLASGHLSVILMVIVVQTMVFKEVISIAHVPSKEKKLPWFRLINWFEYILTLACPVFVQTNNTDQLLAVGTFSSLQIITCMVKPCFHISKRISWSMPSYNHWQLIIASSHSFYT